MTVNESGWVQFPKPEAKENYIVEAGDVLRARRDDDGTILIEAAFVFHSTGNGNFTHTDLQRIFAEAPGEGSDPSMTAYDVDTGDVAVEFFEWVPVTDPAEDWAKAAREKLAS
jgi:hypothetical protein